ncbi:hypothetical protein [Vibrio penaeicida]|uniref:hypothetical protein n=1 Tax=Vibrio penaeicida TaxID=104609 RepID=UPI001CC76FCF|nr:hypothetical protein [Vibrio penaeicida]
MEKIFYDMMPDFTVSVYMEGEWDFFKSWANLNSYCDLHFDDYELISITDTTYQERVELGIINE